MAPQNIKDHFTQLLWWENPYIVRIFFGFKDILQIDDTSPCNWSPSIIINRYVGWFFSLFVF